MSATATLAEMVLSARRRADMETSNFLAAAEWSEAVNKGAARLYALIVRTNEDALSDVAAQFNLVAGTNLYALGTNVMRVLQVDQINGIDRYPVQRFMHAERGVYQSSNAYAPMMYRVTQRSLEFLPSVSTQYPVQYRYVPEFSKLTNDAATLHPAMAEGWEEYPVIYAAIRALKKRQSETGDLMQELAQLEAEIIDQASAPDQNENARVADVSGRFSRSGRFTGLY